jgi:carbon monoxide dehydrogenase subunit G
MELVNDFTVNSPIGETWSTLTDVERIAPCLPGAQLEEIEGDTFRGTVKVKVGPILAKFKGQAEFVERDDQNYRAVLKADGRDTGGKGNASALITAQLEAISDSMTKCSVATDLTITGKVAQFGRGAMQDISTKLLGQFVDNLEGLMSEPTPDQTASDEATAAAGGGSVGASTPETPDGSASMPASPTVRRIASQEAEPIDLLETAGAPLLKRLIPLVGVLIVLVLLLRRKRRSS